MPANTDEQYSVPKLNNAHGVQSHGGNQCSHAIPGNVNNGLRTGLYDDDGARNICEHDPNSVCIKTFRNLDNGLQSSIHLHGDHSQCIGVGLPH